LGDLAFLGLAAAFFTAGSFAFGFYVKVFIPVYGGFFENKTMGNSRSYPPLFLLSKLLVFGQRDRLV
jgi:hypothetical protein